MLGGVRCPEILCTNTAQHIILAGAHSTGAPSVWYTVLSPGPGKVCGSPPSLSCIYQPLPICLLAPSPLPCVISLVYTGFSHDLTRFTSCKDAGLAWGRKLFNHWRGSYFTQFNTICSHSPRYHFRIVTEEGIPLPKTMPALLSITVSVGIRSFKFPFLCSLKAKYTNCQRGNGTGSHLLNLRRTLKKSIPFQNQEGHLHLLSAWHPR